MTMAAPHCSCNSPLYLGDRCAVHGSRWMRDRIEAAERARDHFRAALERIESHGAGVAVEIAREALTTPSTREQKP